MRNYEVLTGDAEVKRLAEIKLMADLEEKAALASARENGTKRGQELGLKQGKDLGLKQGKELGLKQGKELGLKQGQEQGLKEGKREIARKLLKMKMPIEEIIKITGLSENDIK